MNYEEKMELWREFAKLKKVRAQAALPPVILFVPLKKQQPPLIFAAFWKAALFIGLKLGIAWGLFLWVFTWNDPTPIIYLVFASALFGSITGLMTALIFKFKKKKLGLTTWEEFPNAPPAQNVNNLVR